MSQDNNETKPNTKGHGIEEHLRRFLGRQIPCGLSGMVEIEIIEITRFLLPAIGGIQTEVHRPLWVLPDEDDRQREVLKCGKSVPTGPLSNRDFVDPQAFVPWRKLPVGAPNPSEHPLQTVSVPPHLSVLPSVLPPHPAVVSAVQLHVLALQLLQSSTSCQTPLAGLKMFCH